MDKKQVVLSVNLSEEARQKLARAGIIRYQNGKSAKGYGKVSKGINRIICDHLKGDLKLQTLIDDGLAIDRQIHKLQAERKRITEQIKHIKGENKENEKI